MKLMEAQAFFSTDRYEDWFQVAERPNKRGVFLHHYKTRLKDHLQQSSVSQVSCVGVPLRTVVGVFACQSPVLPTDL